MRGESFYYFVTRTYKGLLFWEVTHRLLSTKLQRIRSTFILYIECVFIGRYTITQNTSLFNMNDGIYFKLMNLSRLKWDRLFFQNFYQINPFFKSTTFFFFGDAYVFELFECCIMNRKSRMD